METQFLNGNSIFKNNISIWKLRKNNLNNYLYYIINVG
jgi:hypothetical protein